MLAFEIKSNLQYCEALKLSSGDAVRRENEEGESVGRSLKKTAVNIQARLGGECQDSCKIFQTWCLQFGSHIHPLAPLWKHRAPWPLSWRRAGMQHADTAASAGNLSGPTRPSAAVSRRCVSFRSEGRWQEFICFCCINRKQNPKRDVQEEALLCVLILVSTQIQLSPAGCYQMETMVILKKKDTNTIL